MSASCPTCGHAIESPEILAESVMSGPFTKSERRIIAQLLRSYPRGVPVDTLIDAVYFDDPDGGPEGAGAVVSVMLSRIRTKLPKFGWSIPLLRGYGSHSSYRLEKLP